MRLRRSNVWGVGIRGHIQAVGIDDAGRRQHNRVAAALVERPIPA